MIRRLPHSLPCAALVLLLLLACLAGCGGGNTPDTAEPLSPAVVPTLQGRIVYSTNVANTSNYNLYVLTLPLPGTRTLLVGGSAREVEPVWSPGGKKVLFASDRIGRSQLYVISADGTGFARLTTTSGSDGDPTWSPNGQKIAFTRTLASPPGMFICTANADGSGVKAITSKTGLAGAPAWSPDGQRLAYIAASGSNVDIYTMKASDGSNPIRLTTNAAYDAYPAYSPDGTKIVFISDRDTTGEDESIWLMNANGTGQARLTSGHHDQRPRFNSTGRYIVFSRFIVGGKKIMAIKPDKTGLIAITKGTAEDSHPSWWQPTP